MATAVRILIDGMAHGLFTGNKLADHDYLVHTTRDIEELQRWRLGPDQYHKERLAAVKAIEGRTEEWFWSLEGEVRKIDNLAYRIAAAEQMMASTAAAIKGLQALVSAQSGDIKVIREILQRIEAGSEEMRGRRKRQPRRPLFRGASYHPEYRLATILA
ncbi:hypothetical protein [Shinella sp. G-2]|uniref:hypothetical protein n=1 Tax=Shinella sp. G-2 TaxID=3133141 RepID=UPI003D0886F7